MQRLFESTKTQPETTYIIRDLIDAIYDPNPQEVKKILTKRNTKGDPIIDLNDGTKVTGFGDNNTALIMAMKSTELNEEIIQTFLKICDNEGNPTIDIDRVGSNGDTAIDWLFFERSNREEDSAARLRILQSILAVKKNPANLTHKTLIKAQHLNDAACFKILIELKNAKGEKIFDINAIHDGLTLLDLALVKLAFAKKTHKEIKNQAGEIKNVFDPKPYKVMINTIRELGGLTAAMVNMPPKRKLLNGTPLEVPALMFGTGKLCGYVKDNEIVTPAMQHEILQQAINVGAGLDCSTLYGVSAALQAIGNFLKTQPDPNKVFISSKVGFVVKEGGQRSKFDKHFNDRQDKHVETDYTYDGIMTAMKTTTDCLQRSYVDILYVHDLGKHQQGDQHEAKMDEFYDEKTGGWRAMLELRKNGSAKAIGLGVNEWQVCVDFIKRGEAQNPPLIPDCIMLAGRYTLLDQSAMEGEFFPLCAKYNISVTVAGVYNSGILSSDSNNSYFYEPAQQEILARKNTLIEICKKHNMLLPRATIEFSLTHPNVISVATSGSAAEIKLTAEHVAAIYRDQKQNVTHPEFWDALREAKFIHPEAPTPGSAKKLQAKL